MINRRKLFTTVLDCNLFLTLGFESSTLTHGWQCLDLMLRKVITRCNRSFAALWIALRNCIWDHNWWSIRVDFGLQPDRLYRMINKVVVIKATHDVKGPLSMRVIYTTALWHNWLLFLLTSWGAFEFAQRWLKIHISLPTMLCCLWLRSGQQFIGCFMTIIMYTFKILNVVVRNLRLDYYKTITWFHQGRLLQRFKRLLAEFIQIVFHG